MTFVLNLAPSWLRSEEPTMVSRLNVDPLRLCVEPPPALEKLPVLCENSSARMGEKFPNLPVELRNCSNALDVLVHLNELFRRFIVDVEESSASYASVTL